MTDMKDQKDQKDKALYDKEPTNHENNSSNPKTQISALYCEVHEDEQCN